MMRVSLQSDEGLHIVSINGLKDLLGLFEKFDGDLVLGMPKGKKFVWPRAPGIVMAHYLRGTDIKEAVEVWTEVMPEHKGSGVLAAPTKKGVQLLYSVTDTSDWKRVLEIAYKRCWLKGLCKYDVTETGQAVEIMPFKRTCDAGTLVRIRQYG